MSVLENFHYQISGLTASVDNRPMKRLVFLHGVMGFGSNFRSISKHFEDRYQILLYDQRGHGRSFQPQSTPGSGYQMEDYSRDLFEILKELGWSQIDLVGHSMGGRVAAQFASEHPEIVTRLVVEDIGPSMPKVASSLILRILDTVPVPFADKRAAKAWFEKDFLELFKDEFKVRGLASFLYASITENSKKEAVWRFSPAAIRESVVEGREWQGWQEIQSLHCPTLLIRGEFSHDLPRDLFELMLEANPVIEGVEIKGSAHWIHADQPEVFARCLDRFFNGDRQEVDEHTEPVRIVHSRGL